MKPKLCTCFFLTDVTRFNVLHLVFFIFEGFNILYPMRTWSRAGSAAWNAST